MQRRLAKFVSGNYRRTQPITDMIKELECYSLEDRRRVVGVYKVYIGDEACKDIDGRIRRGVWKRKDDYDHTLALDFGHKGVERFSFEGEESGIGINYEK